MAVAPIRALVTFGKNVWRLANKPVSIREIGSRATFTISIGQKSVPVSIGQKSVPVSIRQDINLNLTALSPNTAARLQIGGQTIYLPERETIHIGSTESDDICLPIGSASFVICAHGGNVFIHNCSQKPKGRSIGIVKDNGENIVLPPNNPGETIDSPGTKAMIDENGRILLLVDKQKVEIGFTIERDDVKGLLEEMARTELAPITNVPIAENDPAELEAALFESGVLEGTIYSDARTLADMHRIDQDQIEDIESRARKIESVAEGLKIIGILASFVLGSSTLGFGFEDGFTSHPMLDLAFLTALFGTLKTYEVSSKANNERRLGIWDHEPDYKPTSRKAKRHDRQTAMALSQLSPETAGKYLSRVGEYRRRKLIKLMQGMGTPREQIQAIALAAYGQITKQSEIKEPVEPVAVIADNGADPENEIKPASKRALAQGQTA